MSTDIYDIQSIRKAVKNFKYLNPNDMLERACVINTKAKELNVNISVPHTSLFYKYVDNNGVKNTLNIDDSDIIEWNDNFFPSYSPDKMIRMGVFKDKISDIQTIPYFWNTELSIDVYDYKVLNSSTDTQQTMREYEWFTWYLQYFMGGHTSNDIPYIQQWKVNIIKLLFKLNTNRYDNNIIRHKLLYYGWDYNSDINDDIHNNNLIKIKKQSINNIWCIRKNNYNKRYDIISFKPNDIIDNSMIPLFKKYKILEYNNINYNAIRDGINIKVVDEISDIDMILVKSD